MFRFKKISLALCGVAAMAIVAFALMVFVNQNMPSLFAPLGGGDSAVVFFSVAGAFGAGYVVAVPRERKK